MRIFFQIKNVELMNSIVTKRCYVSFFNFFFIWKSIFAFVYVFAMWVSSL